MMWASWIRWLIGLVVLIRLLVLKRLTFLLERILWLTELSIKKCLISLFGLLEYSLIVYVIDVRAENSSLLAETQHGLIVVTSRILLLLLPNLRFILYYFYCFILHVLVIMLRRSFSYILSNPFIRIVYRLIARIILGRLLGILVETLVELIGISSFQLVCGLNLSFLALVDSL